GGGLQVGTAALVEPDLGAADGGTDGLDGSAGEAQGNGALTRREFVVHGYLRVAAAGGCPRGEVFAREGGGRPRGRGGTTRQQGKKRCRVGGAFGKRSPGGSTIKSGCWFARKAFKPGG